MKRKLLFALLLASLPSFSQYTSIPNLNFEKVLIELGIDSGQTDGKVLTANVVSVTELLISYRNIIDLTGIQDFVALKTLNCSGNRLYNLDVSKNVALISLSCGWSYIESLDISKNLALTDLSVFSTRITSLDCSKNLLLKNLDCRDNLYLMILDISKNEALTYLDCNGCKIASLDVSNKKYLTYLNCGNNLLTSLDVSKNILLTDLKCYLNKLAFLDVSNNALLTKLNCHSNQLTRLAISKNILLIDLNCSFNLLTHLDVSKNIALKILYCDLNHFLTKLDVSKNISLTSLITSNNRSLTQLNLKNGNNNLLAIGRFSNNRKLTCIQVDNADDANANNNWSKDAQANYTNSCGENLYTLIPDLNFEKKLIALGLDTGVPDGQIQTASINTITSLDVSQSSISNLRGIENFLALTNLNCSNNQLTSLDLSENVELTNLDCSNNLLTSLNIKNSNNINLSTTSNFKNNPNLNCIRVENPTFSSDNWGAIKDETASYATFCEYTLIPDKNFENHLYGLGIDIYENDGKVLTEDIKTITELNMSSSYYFPPIKDLTGIQGFISLKTLSVSGNELKSLDFSKNIALTKLILHENNLTALDISKNIALNYLEIRSSLSFLDVSKNTALTSLSCIYNKLTNLDLSENVALTNLYCSNNLLTRLDVSKNVALTSLYCSYNQLTRLDISKNVVLTNVECDNNKLSSLDISKNIALTKLFCNDNQLTSLNLKNGNNKSFSYGTCDNNPYLTCIQVDNTTYSNNDWIFKKNFEATYSSFCEVPKYTLIPDENFEYRLIFLGLDFGETDGQVLTKNINTLSSLDISKGFIVDLTGIQDFVALTDLQCNNNFLTSLDISKNEALTRLNCSNNELTYLNLKNRKNKLLEGSCSKNPNLSCILVDDVNYSNNNSSFAKDATASYNTFCEVPKYTLIPDENFEQKLISLGLDTGSIDGKVLTKNINMVTSLYVSFSSISDLTGIEDFTALQELYCSNSQLTSLNVSKNTTLTYLNCSTNKLTYLDVSNNLFLNKLYCFRNQIISLDISKNINLTTLWCHQNSITRLDVSKNTILTELDCSSNQLTSLDVSKNVALVSLYCFDNQLTSLNLKNGKNTLLKEGDFNKNPYLFCIQVDNVTYSNSNWEAMNLAKNYSENCQAPSFIVINSTLEDKLIALGIDTDGKNNTVLLASIINLKTVDLSNSGITNLSGIEYFTALERLICRGNSISSLNLSSNLALKYLDYSSNPLTTLDISKNTLLEELYCDGITTINAKNSNVKGATSQLTILDVSNNLLLTKLSCSNNQLKDLDVSKNTLLTSINCSNNKLQKLNLNNGNNTNMSDVNFKNNTSLSCIKVDNLTYSNANWTNVKDATATYNTECFSLPVDNFNITTKSESCINQNNGEISIVATATYVYKASVNNKWYDFINNNLTISDLGPGTYTVSITIPTETFEQKFIITIPKGVTITGTSSKSADEISIKIDTGTAPYSVFVDGVEQFKTNESSFTVEGKKGGFLEVKTAKECEGIFVKDIVDLTRTITAYPNPTTGIFEIELPRSKKEVNIKLHSLNGQLISNEIYPIENGKVSLSLKNQPIGIYIVKIELDTTDYLKIIKK